MEYLDLICFFILVTLKLMVYGRQLENEYFSYSALLVPILSSILILISFSILFSNKTRSKFLYFSNVIITILIIGDTNYFRYFKDVISLLVIKNSTMIHDVGASVENIFKPQDLLYALDLLILPIVNHFKANKSGKLRPIIKFACFLVLLLVGASVDGMKIYALSKDQWDALMSVERPAGRPHK
jgi:phosphoglycerol transferase MdoB-like AlkP superfamily enzyme